MTSGSPTWLDADFLPAHVKQCTVSASAGLQYMLPAPSDNILHATANPALHTWQNQYSAAFLMLGSCLPDVNAGRLGHTSKSTATTDKAGRLH